jgi:Zn-finger protein
VEDGENCIMCFILLYSLTNSISVKIKNYNMGGHVPEMKNQINAKNFYQKT